MAPWGLRSSSAVLSACSLGLRLAHALVRLAAVAAHQGAGAGFEDGVLGAGRARARRAHEHHVRIVQGCLEVDAPTPADSDAAALLSRLRVALQDVDALADDLVLVGAIAPHLPL